ncbi:MULTISPECIES: hypothetical protein [unclassified Methylobacterium]|nr:MULTISPECIES: hypothetical protein [unclassified Methylobacterium]
MDRFVEALLRRCLDAAGAGDARGRLGFDGPPMPAGMLQMQRIER